MPASPNHTLRIQGIALVLGTLVLIAKFYAWNLTHSNAIFSDALESIINIAAGIFALFSLWFAARPRDKSHPYGHGKIEYLAAGFEGALIILAGMSIIGKSIHSLFAPHAIQALPTGLWIIGISGLINFFIGRWLIQAGRSARSLIMVADGKHLISDAWTSLGLILGMGLVFFTNWFWLDSLVAIVFAVLILVTGWQLIRRSISGIMDESDQLLMQQVLATLKENRRDAWIDIHNLRVIMYGPVLHLDAHMTIPWYFNIRQAHREMDALETAIRLKLGSQAEVFIHQDPCQPYSCSICTIQNCPERQHSFIAELDWTLDNLMDDTAHNQRVAY